MRKIIRLMAAVIIFLTACSKEETPTPQGQTPTGNKTPSEHLQGTWSLVSGIWSRPNMADSNVLADCMKDNTITFDVNGTYYQYENANKCDPSSPDRRTGTWKIDSQLLILKDSSNFTAYSDTFTIIKLDESTLKYSSEYDNDGNPLTITWQKQ